MQVVASQQIQDVQVQVLTTQGTFKPGRNRFRLRLEKPDGDPPKVSDIEVDFFMPAMGATASMRAGADLQAITPGGEYSGTVELPMSGNWQMRIHLDTREGPKKIQLNINAQ